MSRSSRAEPTGACSSASPWGSRGCSGGRFRKETPCCNWCFSRSRRFFTLSSMPISRCSSLHRSSRFLSGLVLALHLLGPPGKTTRPDSVAQVPGTGRPRPRCIVVIGEVHQAKRPEPVENPRWLVIPDRGLFTGIAIFGAIGTGKTTGCMYPFAKQISELPRPGQRPPDRWADVGGQRRLLP